MALEKVITYDYEIRGEFKNIQERQKTAIVEDGSELSYSFHRRVLTPDADVSSESDEIKGMADTLWTDAVKAAWFLHQHKYPSGDPSTDWELAQLQKYCDDNSVDYEDGTNLDEDGNAIAANSKAELVELIEAA
jgi:hypothetical protein